MRISRLIGVLALVAVGSAACGEAPQTPAGPTASMGQGARIMGNVSAGAPLAAMTAQVAGTSISTQVGGGGGFAFEGVPAGAVQLRFTGSGVDASVALDPVKTGDVVSLLVGVSGTSATIQSETRNAGGKVELEGRVESLPPTQQANTLVVSGRTVTTGPQTIFRDGNNAGTSFAALAIGQRVHVKGSLAADAIAADIVTIQNTNVSIPVNVNGIVDKLSGTAAAFTFFVGSREVRGDGTTVFFGGTDTLLGFSALKDGARVEVKGEQRDAFVFAVRIHVNGPETPEPQDTSASVEGRLKELSGEIPTLKLIIAAAGGDVIVTTTGATEVQRRGDVQTLKELAVGQTIHAVGTRQADKSIVARKLQIKDDEPEGAFTIEGSLGGLSGVCPAIKFGVNGYSIAATAETEYLPKPTAKCQDLKSGSKVIVEGTRQADGTVKASTITKK